MEIVSRRAFLALPASLVVHHSASLPAEQQDLWQLAREKATAHRFSTLFTAQDVRDRLSSAQGLKDAVAWCRRYGITRVFVESFRDGYLAPQQLLIAARDHFRDQGFEVSGCVTTTQVGKVSTGWKVIACYTDLATQDRLQAIFEYTASLFDEIMIDDFLFTDCACEACEQARRSRRVRVGDSEYPVPGESWEHYRLELMVQLSRHRILAPAKRVNPRARLIIKYPQWYDRFHERGYDVIRQTQDFDLIWVGTETRDRDKRGAMPYEGYFLMRWLSGIGREKTGGGWYDSINTTESTYLEQARGTVLAGARESMLFSYGGLQRSYGPADIEALRLWIPELLAVAGEVRQRKVIGIAAYKPPHSPGEEEAYVFDYVGMLGLPLMPCHEFPSEAQAAFFSIHALKDPLFMERFDRLVRTGVPILMTDGLARRLANKFSPRSDNVQVLQLAGKPTAALELPLPELDRLRQRLLQPFGVSFSGPAEVGLWLFEDGSWVIQNFRDEAVRVSLNGAEIQMGARSWRYRWASAA